MKGELRIRKPKPDYMLYSMLGCSALIMVVVVIGFGFALMYLGEVLNNPTAAARSVGQTWGQLSKAFDEGKHDKPKQ